GISTPGAEAPVTSVGTLELLLVGVGSVSGLLVTEAVLVIRPLALGAFTTSAMEAPLPARIWPRWQTTGEAALHVPCDGVAETRVVPVGRGSSPTTSEASAGPLLVTLMV